MRRGLRRILAYWRAERRTLTQGFVALLIATVGSLAAGVVLGKITGTLERLPGLMVLIPAAIATRGNIFGALGSRLGTSIHAGLFEPNRNREGVLYQNVYSATVLTFVVSFLVALLAKTLSEAFGVTTISLLDFIVIALVGGILSSILVATFAVFLSVGAHRRGWDLDSVAAPLITSAGDMFTIPALFLASFAVGVRWVTETVAVVLVLGTVVITVAGLITNLSLARRVIRESLPILVVAGTIDILAGLVAQARLGEFIALPALLMLIPPILGNAGGLGGILSARLASKLHLGVITAKGRPEALAVLDFSIVLLIAVAVFPVLGLAADVAAAVLHLASPGPAKMMGITLLAGMMATLIAAVIAYYTAVATFRVGLDPDNHGIPMITSSMDFFGILSIVFALVVLGIS
ncbi:MAG: magnesium transporter [Actinomycetota bacterium]